VRRCAIDSWLHLGSSTRKAAEWLRSWIGKQERYLLWRGLAEEEVGREPCRLAASTVERWLDEAGVRAQESVPGQLEGLGPVKAVAGDGLWARLRGGGKRVALLLVDSGSGLILPPVVTLGEESARYWQGLFERARSAGLELEELRGVTSDWAGGLVAYVRERLGWLMHQRCRVNGVGAWHFWRNLSMVARLTMQAAAMGAEVVLFHEGLLVDYPEDPRQLAELVPDGPSTTRLIAIAREQGVHLSVGMAERDGDRLYITQVFCGPQGFVAKYRKTWLWLCRVGDPDAAIRDEWKWYNPGDGPAPIQLGAARASCLICADGNSERAWHQVAEAEPQVVFWPNNRHNFRSVWVQVIDRARQLGKPIVATNRVGLSGSGYCDGGAIIVSGEGHVLAHCLHPGQEEIVLADIAL
jgi:predicted amidohydrolase